MNKLVSLRLRTVAVCVATGVLAFTNSKIAAASFSVVFPAGLACEFNLQVDGTGGHQIMKEFVDKNGDIVRVLSAGTGSALTFTNLDTADTVSSMSNGFTRSVKSNPDGTQTVTSTGHNVIILFPSDTPAGPTTTLYVGRVVYTTDNTGNFILEKTSGASADICAALS